jgi:imidazolonepropionase-like amidohydrolase
MAETALVVHAGRLLVGTGEVIDGAAMVVRNGRIAAVGTRSEIAAPADAVILDAGDQTVMPGIIDCHTHLGGTSSADYQTWVLEDDRQQAMLSTQQMRTLMTHGVTTIRDISRNGLRLKWLVNHGHLAGPRIVACGPGLSRTGGHGDAHNLPCDMIQRSHPWGMLADGPEELRKAVRMLNRMGADAVKIWATGGGMWDKELETDQHYDLDELTMVVREAAMVQMPVLAHAESLAAAKDCLRAGVATLEHGEELDDECRDIMLEQGVIHVPTLQLLLGPWFDAYPPPPRAGLENYRGETMVDKEKNRVADNFAASVKAGITIAVGSDSFSTTLVPYGTTTLAEVHSLAQAGLSNSEAIVAGTLNGAKALRVEHETGSLEVGKSADFIVVDGDPLTTITDLVYERVAYVQRGQHILRDDRAAARGESR